MQKIATPNVKKIASLDDIPNIGLPQSMYEQVLFATFRAVETFREEYGYKDL